MTTNTTTELRCYCDTCPSGICVASAGGFCYMQLSLNRHQDIYRTRNCFNKTEPAFRNLLCNGYLSRTSTTIYRCCNSTNFCNGEEKFEYPADELLKKNIREVQALTRRDGTFFPESGIRDVPDSIYYSSAWTDFWEHFSAVHPALKTLLFTLTVLLFFATLALSLVLYVNYQKKPAQGGRVARYRQLEGAPQAETSFNTAAPSGRAYEFKRLTRFIPGSQVIRDSVAEFKASGRVTFAKRVASRAAAPSATTASKTEPKTAKVAPKDASVASDPEPVPTEPKLPMGALHSKLSHPKETAYAGQMEVDIEAENPPPSTPKSLIHSAVEKMDSWGQAIRSSLEDGMSGIKITVSKSSATSSRAPSRTQGRVNIDPNFLAPPDPQAGPSRRDDESEAMRFARDLQELMARQEAENRANNPQAQNDPPTTEHTWDTAHPTDTSFSGSGSGTKNLSLRSMSQDVQLNLFLGRGSFGQVFRGNYKGVLVAAKIFNEDGKASWERETEIYKTSQLRHQNVLGYIASDRKLGHNIQYWLVTDYYNLGSLCDFLQHNTVGMPDALRIAYQIINGLYHLHSEIIGVSGNRKPAIAHRDIKTKNILIKADGTCVICDLGLAVRYSYLDGIMDIDPAPRAGTRRYLSPEVLSRRIKWTDFEAIKKVDIYALSYCYWELFRRTTMRQTNTDSNRKFWYGADYDRRYWGVYKGNEVPERDPLWEGRAAAVRLAEGPLNDQLPVDLEFEKLAWYVDLLNIRPRMEEHWRYFEPTREVWRIMRECWHKNPNARLDALRIRDDIAAILQKYYKINIADQ